MSAIEFTAQQEFALDLLRSGENVFLTGPAGSGKSTVVKEYVRDLDPKVFPVLASTGAAAVLIGGRTFHSFFGLGILEGGVDKTVERALKDKKLISRLKKVEGVIIDEVSMLSGDTLLAAELIARKARNQKALPWGGLTIIAVGDFAQLPPVFRNSNEKPWAFLSEVWRRTQFVHCVLKENLRSESASFLSVLNQVREGVVTSEVEDFLTDRNFLPCDFGDVTRLFPRRYQTESYNESKLAELESELRIFPTHYFGKPAAIERLKKQAPLPEVLQLKTGCMVMLRQNDPLKRWVNGSTGILEKIEDGKLKVRLKMNGRLVGVEVASFNMLDAEGEVVAGLSNYPVSLAYATTIHKSQGMTLDSLLVDISSLWEPGQAYVALSRIRSPENLYVQKWDHRSIKADPQVKLFYQKIESALA